MNADDELKPIRMEIDEDIAREEAAKTATEIRMGADEEVESEKTKKAPIEIPPIEVEIAPPKTPEHYEFDENNKPEQHLNHSTPKNPSGHDQVSKSTGKKNRSSTFIAPNSHRKVSRVCN